tara:strand:- start:1565 stop:1957 length:393 start_codon:yes stop_codon:yes gene_type:complete
MKKRKKKLLEQIKKMNLQDKTDEEIIKIANPLWDNLVKSSNNKDYSGFTKDFSAKMLYGASEVEIGKQWANNDLLINLSDNYVCLGLLRRDQYITVIYKQKSNKIHGEFLGRLVIGYEDSEIKIFGATIF